jgi:tetratricopeptide (TPR) repeat protein
LLLAGLVLFPAGLSEAAGCANMAPFDSAALLIGISNPRLQEGLQPLHFAGKDADRLQPLFAGFKQNVFVLTNRDATTANVSACLDALARFAKSGSKVVIFISARGFASTETDGYVLTYDSAVDKVPRSGNLQIGNGISIPTLRHKLEAVYRAREKYLLLDLCRDPAEKPTMDNLINKRILDKEFLNEATSRIVLASTGTQRSFESNDLGYYAGALSDVLKGEMGLETLVGELKARIKAKYPRRQVPYLPEPQPKIGKECVLCTLSQRWSTGPLLASASPVVYFQEAPPASSDTTLQILDEAANDEADGQRYFVRYGEGNHFHGDPLNECEHPNPGSLDLPLCAEEYQTAASSFGKAAALREKIPQPAPEGNQSAIESLRERDRFCRAQVSLLTNHPDDAIHELGDPGSFQFAESHNVLGIAFLELTRYPEAEKQFAEAIRMAPHWAYPRHNLALAYVEHSNYTAAENEYREAIRWTPVAIKRASEKDDPCFHGHQVTVVTRPYLYYNFGILLQRLNRLPEARQQYCLAEESFHAELGLLNSDTSGLNAEEKKLAELRSEAAMINLADVNNSLGVLFEGQGKTSQAAAQFDTAVHNNQGLTAARFNLARLRAGQARAKGNLAEARKSYEDFLALYCRGSGEQLACRAAQAQLDALR